MTGRLFAVPPALTGRQQTALDAIRATGWAGLTSAELGAVLHQTRGHHHLQLRCDFCPSTGLEVGKALRAKGLVRQTRREAYGGDRYMVWVDVDARKPSRVGEEIPF